MSDNTAILAGFTREIYVDDGLECRHLFVKPGDYLDGAFRAYDADYCEWVTIAGWRVAIEDVNQEEQTA